MRADVNELELGSLSNSEFKSCQDVHDTIKGKTGNAPASGEYTSPNKQPNNQTTNQTNKQTKLYTLHLHHTWPHYVKQADGSKQLYILVHGWSAGKFAMLKHEPNGEPSVPRGFHAA